MPIKPSPWQQDIESTFTDPEVQEAVDEFMRTRYQPRVTQLEQQLASTRDAQGLWERIHSDPLGTFNQLRDELVGLGYPVAEATAVAQATVEENTAAPAPESVAAAAQEDPRVAEMYADWQRQRELAAYDATIEDIVNRPENADINPNRLHTFVAAADGDFNRALEMYRADVATVLQTYGIDPETATAQQQEQAAELAAGQVAAPGAPPVISNGSGGGAGAPVPTQPDYAAEGISPQDALHKAIEDAAKGALGTGVAPPVS
jgi:hypothetical protein